MAQSMLMLISWYFGEIWQGQT